MKNHSYSGVGSMGLNTSYLNYQQMMAAAAAQNQTPSGYQKFIDATAGIDRNTSNITAEEIAALYSNVLATQSIMSGKRSALGGTSTNLSNMAQ